MSDEKMKAYNHDYYIKHRQRYIDKAKEYNKQHPEVVKKIQEKFHDKALEYARKRWQEKKDEINAKRREKYASDPEYRERVKAQSRKNDKQKWRTKMAQRVLRVETE